MGLITVCCLHFFMKTKMCAIYLSVSTKPEVMKKFDTFHEECGLVPADIHVTCNNIVVVCKIHYYSCI